MTLAHRRRMSTRRATEPVVLLKVTAGGVTRTWHVYDFARMRRYVSSSKPISTEYHNSSDE